MSIASRINEMTEHLRNDWDSIDKLGLDITEENSNDNLDKNIENIAPVLGKFYNQVSDKIDLSENGIVGRTSQSGTPTPDSPQPINNLSGNVAYKVRGQGISESFPLSLKSKNKFNKNTIINGYVNAGGGITNLDGYKSSAYIEIKPNTSYYKSQSGSTRWKYYDENKTVYSSETTDLSNASDEQIFITPSNVKYLRFTMSNDLVGSFILCEGSTVTTYEPYYDIELCNISDYKDRIYSQNREFYLEKKTGKVVLDGSRNWTKSGNTNIDRFVLSGYVDYGNTNCFSNYFTNETYSDSNYNKSKIFLNTYSNTKRLIINFNTIGTTSLSNFKTWLSTHNTEVQYVLATPTTTEITQENYPTLYSQLLAIQEFLTKYKINKEFLLDYSSPEIEY